MISLTGWTPLDLEHFLGNIVTSHAGQPRESMTTSTPVLPTMRINRASRLLTLTPDLFRFLVQRFERSGALSSLESDNGFAQSLDEMPIILKERVTFVADHEEPNGIDAGSSSLRKAAILDKF